MGIALQALSANCRVVWVIELVLERATTGCRQPAASGSHVGKDL